MSYQKSTAKSKLVKKKALYKYFWKTVGFVLFEHEYDGANDSQSEPLDECWKFGGLEQWLMDFFF